MSEIRKERWKDTVSILPDGSEFVVGDLTQHRFQLVPLQHGVVLRFVGLYRRDVLGTGAFRTLAYGIGHLLAFMQGGETDALEGRFMEEQVFVVLRLDEPEVLVRQLFNSAFSHFCVSRSD